MGLLSFLIVLSFLIYWLVAFFDVTMDIILFKDKEDIWASLFIWLFILWGVLNFIYIFI